MCEIEGALTIQTTTVFARQIFLAINTIMIYRVNAQRGRNLVATIFEGV